MQLPSLLDVTTLVIVLAGAVRGVDLLLRPEQKTRMTELARSAWIRFKTSSPEDAVRMPLRGVAWLLDALFTSDATRMRRLGRHAIVSTLLLLVSLSSAGVATGHFLTVQTPPWRDLSETLALLEQHASDAVDAAESSNVASPDSDTQRRLSAAKELADEVGQLQRYRSLGWQVAYTLFVLLAVLLINSLISLIVVAIARGILRVLVEADGAFVSAGMIVFGSVSAGLAIAVMLALLSIVTSPLVLVAVPVLARLPIALLPLLFAGLTVGGWWLGGAFLRTAAVNAAWPLLLALLGVLVALLLYPIRRWVHRALNHILRSAVEHGSGSLAFFSVSIMTLAGVVAGIAKLTS